MTTNSARQVRSEPAPSTIAKGRVDVTDLLGFKLLRLSNTLGLAAERQYVRQFGLSVPEWRCLSIVVSKGPVSATDIAIAIKTDKAWVSRTIGRLLNRGLVLVRQDTRDRRRTVIRTSARGRAMNDRILEAATARHRWLLDGLSESHREAFVSAMETLQSRAEALLAG